LKTGHGGCRYCANYGIQYSKPAYLYLITNQLLNAHKIGIANPAKVKKSDRLHRYQFHGWQVIQVWNISSGKSAEKIENRILYAVRSEMKIPIFLTKREMAGQGGHTETMSADSISLTKLKKLISKAIKEYSDN
jgi:hypothetical protein